METPQPLPGVLVIGAGPAGLMAAETLSSRGHAVVLTDAMPSPARKFLMAGRSGLNLTKAEAPDAFLAAYGPAAPWLAPMLSAFGPQAARDWAEGLGQETFVGSTGRVFPRSMKASPLLRAWLARLEGRDVSLRRRWRWTGWDRDAARFETPDGPRLIRARATVLALGGGSWARLGSDGRWFSELVEAGVDCEPIRPANMGFVIDWSPAMTPHFGAPVKAAALTAGGSRARGEFAVSARGIEGGAVYEVSSAVRDGAALILDLLPDLSVEAAAARLAGTRRSESLGNRLRKAWRLQGVRRALLMEFGRPLPEAPECLAALSKALPVRHLGPRPLDEAISTAGGVARRALEGLQLRARPGVFCAGEMLDWEAPTGGYLLTACLATGRQAGLEAARLLEGVATGG